MKLPFECCSVLKTIPSTRFDVCWRWVLVLICANCEIFIVFWEVVDVTRETKRFKEFILQGLIRIELTFSFTSSSSLS